MRGWLTGLVLLCAASAAAEPIRVATFNASLSRNGPGVLVGDLLAQTPETALAVDVIAQVRPDILLLNEVDYDAGGEAAGLLRAALAARGLELSHRFLAPSNTGVPSGVDLNGDGTATGPADAHGFGRFPGQYGMLLLSRFPIAEADSATFQTLLWRDPPGATLPVTPAGAPFPSAEAHALWRLSSKSHWDVAGDTPAGRLHVFASHPTPPVFDGPEDHNGLRNRDEILFWVRYLDGAVLPADGGPRQRAAAPFVLLGDLNADPADGDGLRDGIGTLLNHALIQDPGQTSEGGRRAAAQQGGANSGQSGDPAKDTADFNDERGPGNLRVDYALPSADLRVVDSGVFWPEPGAADAALAKASDHSLVWVDIDWP